MGCRHAALGLALLLLAGTGRADADPGTGGEACVRAGDAAERRFGVPPGLLVAIGRVESGRPGPGGAVPWPWAINVAGEGRYPAGRDEAVAAVAAARAAGAVSIDVGCFQVSLLYHPAAFASLEEAFDPEANAAYAARFLAGLRARLGDWPAAVAAYHSAVPVHGLPYRDRVLASWGGAGAAAASVSVVAGVRIVAPVPRGLAPSVIRLNAAGPAGGGVRVVRGGG